MCTNTCYKLSLALHECPSLLRGHPLSKDPLPRPLDPMLVFSHLSQPTPTGGTHLYRLSPHWSLACVCTASMQLRDLSPLHCIFTHSHTHMSTCTMPTTIPSQSAPTLGIQRRPPISAGCLWPLLLFCLSHCSPRVPPHSQPGTWYWAALFSVWGG